MARTWLGWLAERDRPDGVPADRPLRDLVGGDRAARRRVPRARHGDATGRGDPRAQSVVIIIKVHAPSGFWNKSSGIEFPLALGTAALVIGLTGPGTVSFDAVEGLATSDTVRIVLVVAGIVCGAIALAVPTAATSSEFREADGHRPLTPTIHRCRPPSASCSSG